MSSVGGTEINLEKSPRPLSAEKSMSFNTMVTEMQVSTKSEKPVSATRCNSDNLLQESAKTKDKISRPRSCGAEHLSQDTDSISTTTRESTPVVQEKNAWFFSIDKKKIRSRSMSKSSAKESEKSVNQSVNSASIVKQNASGIPLPKKPISTKGPCSKAASRPVSRTSLKRSASSDLKKNIPSLAKRNLEHQFTIKKKRLDTLKRDLIEKQKPVLDIYQALTQLKKKLEDAGKSVKLEELKFIDCSEAPTTIQTTNSANKREPTQADLEILTVMKTTINLIPKPLSDICKNLLTRRTVVIEHLGKYCGSEADVSELQKKIESWKNESSQLEKKIEETLTEQETKVNDLVQKWQDIVEGKEIIMQPPPQPTVPSERVVDMHRKIKKQENEIKELKNKIEELHSALKERPERGDLNKAEDNIKQLNSRLKELESQLAEEKKKVEQGLEIERQLKNAKCRNKDIEVKKHDVEKQLLNLQKLLKQKDDTMKAAEKAWNSEKQELIKMNNNDKQLLNKLTKDRGLLETRMKTMGELLEENDKTSKDLEEKWREEVREAKMELQEETMKREKMEKKYESIREELMKMEVTNQQAFDLVVTRTSLNGEGTVSTQRETEMYTELLATRIALTAAEDKVKNYAREKLRFIDTIEKLSNTAENNVESLAASLVKKEEEITNLENKIEEYEKTVQKQDLEIASVNANLVNLEERLILTSEQVNNSINNSEEEDAAKGVLQENKQKIEEILKKSLEYEQRVIKYQFDLEMQQKQLLEMDNLLKVRDGLIGMLKMKKDELFVENDGLTKYAQEMRGAVMDTKRELALKQEEIKDLFGQLEQKSKMLIKQEKKIKELKDTLSTTNEKRYKLQDTLGAMEKELQSTKAHVNRMSSEIQARTKFKLL